MRLNRLARRLAVLYCCGIAPASSSQQEGAEQLLPETALSTNCYNFPEESFGRSNSVRNTYGSSPHLGLDLGAPAIDFTLHDTDGTRWNLGEVLKAGNGKPVVLIFGMLTCPAYEGLGADGSTDSWGYWHEQQLVKEYRDKAIFAHVYGPEPHPAIPDVNFDSGRVLPNFWSTRRQSLTYEDRLAQARRIRSITHHDQVILPDYLTGNPYSSLNQPVWCSYAQGARSSVVIASGGHVFYQQGWLHTDRLGRAIDRYWEQDGQGSWDDDDGSNRGPSGKKKASKPKDGKGKENRKQP